MKITAALRKKLGTLIDLADQIVAQVIRDRGGIAANVIEAGPWARRTLGETAVAAIAGDKTAQRAIKIAKDAKRLGRKYGGDAS